MNPHDDRDDDRITSESKPAFVLGAIAADILLWVLIIIAATGYVRA